MIARPALAASLLMLTGLASPATAQSSVPLPPNLAGLWSFEADLEAICKFNGHARLMPTSDPARFDCELTAEQDCPAADVHYIVQQSCSVDIVDGVATVRSTIETFLVGEPTTGYLPDNFQLVIHDESHLEGVLLGSGAYPAEWRRAEGAIS
ncbi:hypothetical protein D1227_11075 [Henriciella mobilis]|uniref:hypothetical protein n=1 Tax=Henriciella mobilis TaxID=2305467 RepID=UPI000E66E7E8|nr:hypothetical protein [Henriciella mobilis]RIJ13933.1 hypothetical protein D1231_19290 [Henriciella mobilis]RIJ20858.1 hypothetical protein D1227_11075 [Henriciella mobilis]